MVGTHQGYSREQSTNVANNTCSYIKIVDVAGTSMRSMDSLHHAFLSKAGIEQDESIQQNGFEGLPKPLLKGNMAMAALWNTKMTAVPKKKKPPINTHITGLSFLQGR